MKQLIKYVRIVTCDEDFTLYDGGMIAIDDGQLTYVGEQDDAYMASFGADEVIEGNDNIVMPGLVNAHTHLSMTLLRGHGSDLPLREWLEDKMWPAEAKLVDRDCYIGSMIGLAEMLRSGTTAFLDMYFHMDQTAEAVKEAGLRAVLTPGVVAGNDLEDRVTGIKKLRADYQEDWCIYVWPGPHAEYTNTTESLKRSVELAKELGCGLHIHLSETEREVEECVARHGMSPVKYFNEIGIFDVPTVAAHCVAVDDDDIKILSEKHVNVVHNPTSNMKLASGCAPVQRMLDAGINVALGTDGAASNNNLDMLEEMHIAALIAKGFTGDPTALNASQVIKMATINGAKALGMEDSIGSLEVGKQADLIMLDGHSVFSRPRGEWLNNLVYSMGRSDVVMTMIDGKILMRDGAYTTIAINKMLEAFDQSATRLTMD